MGGEERVEPLKPAMSVKKQDSDLFPFMKLPPELRNKIYRYLLPTKAIPARKHGFIEGISEDRVLCHPAILRVSRLVHDEAFGILCEKLRFGIDIDRTGVFVYKGSQLPGWKQWRRAISDFPSAKAYLGNHCELFTKACELHINVTVPAHHTWDFPVASGGLWMEMAMDGSFHSTKEHAYDIKDNVLLLADLIRETAFRRKKQGLPMLRIIVKPGTETWADPVELCNRLWYLRPLENMRAINLVGNPLHRDGDFPLAGYWGYETFRAWTENLRKLAAGSSALPEPAIKKRQMYDQLSRLMDFMQNIGADVSTKNLWEHYYCARHAFEAGNVEEFESRVRNVVKVWERILEARRQQESRAAVSFAALVGDLSKK